MTTGKTIALTRWTFVSKVMSPKLWHQREGQRQSLYYPLDCHCAPLMLTATKALRKLVRTSTSELSPGTELQEVNPPAPSAPGEELLGVEFWIHLTTGSSATHLSSPGSVTRVKLQAKSYRYWELVTQGNTGRYPQHVLKLKNQFMPAFKKKKKCISPVGPNHLS